MPRDNSEFGSNTGRPRKANVSVIAMEILPSGAFNPQTPPMAGGGGHATVGFQSENASPNLTPPRKRGRPRKANSLLISRTELPTGALNTETQQETAAGEGQYVVDIHPSRALAFSSETSAQQPAGGGHYRSDAQGDAASPSFHATGQPAGGGKRRARPEMFPMAVLPDLATIIADLRLDQNERRFLLRSQNRHNNDTLAFVRMALGWSPELPEQERSKIKTLAQAVVQAVEKGKDLTGEQKRTPVRCVMMIMTAAKAREPLDKRRLEIEANMERLAKLLPVWSWVDSSPTAKGFAALSLAVVVGEAGNLSGYKNPAKLWKRFGLAPHQGLAPSTWRIKGGLSSDDWISLGYSPSRRSEMWNRGVSLVRAQVRASKDENGKKAGDSYAIGPLGQIYLDRKTLELTKGITPKHADNRARRYIEKRLLRDLWRAWRDTDQANF